MTIMKTPNKRQDNGFTLIELLVVMAIIVTLAAVGFAAGAAAIKRARMTQALNTCTGIESGINRYYDEYGALPFTGSSSPTVDTGYRTSASPLDGGTVKTLTTSIDIITVLMGKEETPTQNTKAVKYVELQLAKGSPRSQGGSPKGGVSFATTSTSIPEAVNDPWGCSYAIYLDYDYSEDITDPITRSGSVRGRHALCYTLGQAQNETKPSDIVKTW